MAEKLYNGVKLPALPIVEGYDYSYMTSQWVDDSGYKLMLCSSRVHMNGILGYPVPMDDVSDLLIYYSDGTSEWELSGEYSGIAPNSLLWIMDGSLIFWTNTDILNEDGTLYLAASDPIPVTITAPIDPTSLLMGYRVGQMIRGMRLKKEPVAFLYNGVRLPKLPDVEGYPFKVIYYLLDDEYM